MTIIQKIPQGSLYLGAVLTVEKMRMMEKLDFCAQGMCSLLKGREEDLWADCCAVNLKSQTSQEGLINMPQKLTEGTPVVRCVA